MKTKQRLHSITLGSVKTFAFALLLAMSVCGGQDEPSMEKPGEVRLSDTEISLEVADWKPLQESRATLYDQNCFFEGNNENTLPVETLPSMLTRVTDRLSWTGR